MLRHAFGYIGSVCLLVACVADPAPTQSVSTLAPGQFALATAVPAIANSSCAGVGLTDDVLHGAPGDPGTAWVGSGERRIELVWPPGFVARFSPTLEVVDATGKVVLREGDPIGGGCVTGDRHVLYIPPWEL